MSAHAQAMDRIYRHQRRIYDLTRKYYLFGRDRLIGELDLLPGETLLEVGCGTARNLIAIARAYPQARLYGLDASREMLKTADKAIALAGFADRIELFQGLAEELTTAALGLNNQLDHIVFSYSLSMIPDWRRALSAARAALKPEGRLHIVDFGDFARLPRPVRPLMRAWLEQFHVVPRQELLRGLETWEPTPSRRFRFLAGRYSFLLSAAQNDLFELPG